MKIKQIVYENTENLRDSELKEYTSNSAMAGLDPDFDRMLLRREARRMGMTVDEYLHYLKKQEQDREHELSIGTAGRAELKAKADELAEIKRQQLRKERLQDEELAYSRAKDKAEREAEMEKIKRKYEHELKVIDKEHSNNMEAIRTGNAHEIDKMEREHRHEKEMFDKEAAERDKDRVKPEPQKPQQAQKPPKPPKPPEPEEEPEVDNYDSETGEPLRPQLQRPQKPTQWHTSQQVGYTPTKPQKPNDDDVIDVVAKPPKDKKDDKPSTPQLGYTKESIDRIIKLAGIKK